MKRERSEKCNENLTVQKEVARRRFTINYLNFVVNTLAVEELLILCARQKTGL